MNTSLDNLSSEKLLAFITQQQEHIVQLQERIKILENEITRLKKLNPRPDIKPNAKPSDSHDDNGNNNDDSQSHDHESDEEPESKDELLTTGIRCSRYLQTDDTGARHQGQNGYCTVITNALFTWFGTTESKSRENFLALLHRPYRTYVLNAEAIGYLKEHKFAKKWHHVLAQYQDVHFLSEKARKAFMNDIGLTGSRNRQRASEAMLYGSLISHGFNLVTFSDGGGQFNVFAHAQCWVHAARPMEKVIPVNRQQVNAQYWCLSWFWNTYRDLKAFRESPSDEKAAEIRAAFKSLIQTQTGCSGLQDALAGLAVIEQELLMVLDNPVLPLHNNLSESQIREHVKRRKISGGTKSESGRRSRDTFASLKKTCRQYGLSFWHYLTERLTGSGTFPRLAQKIESAAQWLSCGSSVAF